MNLRMTLGPQDQGRHFEYRFDISEGARSFRILFHYDPMEVPVSPAWDRAFKEGLKGMALDETQAKAFMADYDLSLYNHLTLSLYQGEDYLGANHRHETDQDLRFTGQEAPLGFQPPEEIKGRYRLILSAFGVFCPMDVTLAVEVDHVA